MSSFPSALLSMVRAFLTLTQFRAILSSFPVYWYHPVDLLELRHVSSWPTLDLRGAHGRLDLEFVKWE
jgi:hypothetical protein